MNLFRGFSLKKKYFHINNPTTPFDLSQTLLHWLPKDKIDLIILCIGSDRSTGDSFGPLTGTLLHQKGIKNCFIIGTVEEPVHAVNLQEIINFIYNNFSNPFVIAIDACLGKSTSVESFILGKGSMKPGLAVNKNLPFIGDIYISAVVNVFNKKGCHILQTTRLSVVCKMADNLSNSLALLDSQLTSKEPFRKLE